MKKGELTGTMMVSILLAGVGVFALLAMAGIIKDVSLGFISNQDEGVIRNLEVIKESTDYLLLHPLENKAIKTPFSLKGNYMVVAYDPEFVAEAIGDKSLNLGKFVKPKDECENNGCLCAYKKIKMENNALKAKLLECFSFDDNVYFYSQDYGGDNIIGGRSKDMGFEINDERYYEHFIVFGKDRNLVKAFGSKVIYIEKREIEDKYYIFISDNLPEVIEDRGISSE
jgi:hypothetical protein